MLSHNAHCTSLHVFYIYKHVIIIMRCQISTVVVGARKGGGGSTWFHAHVVLMFVKKEINICIP